MRKHFLSLVIAALGAASSVAQESSRSPSVRTTDPLWQHDNLIAWCVVPFDAKMRGPEERAAMLAKLGFKQFAYDWRAKDVPTFDAEIEALQRHDIKLAAWWFPADASDPLAKTTLETFKRHRVQPQLWVSLRFEIKGWPKDVSGWNKLLPAGVTMPADEAARKKLSAEERERLAAARREIVAELMRDSLPKTEAEQARQVEGAADRIRELVELAAPYGCRVMLYNHNGWFGMMENQVAIIEHLKARGISSVGIVYNFSHARDDLHDDSKNFPAIWRMIQPYVGAVNVTGLAPEGTLIYPSQGDGELDMMRVIQESGWKGPIGLIAEKGGDAEVTLGNYLIGLDWLATELNAPGSAGERPFAKAK